MNITLQDNLFRVVDQLSQQTYSVILSKSGTGIDCREASSITGFSITESQPSGTEIRVAFSDGATWFSLNTSGGAVKISAVDPTYEQLRAYGNTTAQLKALTSVPAFVGKMIRVAVALTTNDVKNVKPTLKIGVKANALRTSTELIEYSPVYDLGGNASVGEITFSQSVSGGASVTVAGKLFREDGSESDWLSPDDIRGAYGSALQLRCVYTVTAAGTGSARLDRAEASCISGGVSGITGAGEIYFVTDDWQAPVRTCRVNLRHSALDDNTLAVYAAFRPAPIYAVREKLGISSGKRDTFNLAHRNGIKADTFRIWSDEQELFSGFELNGVAGRVSLTTTEGSIVTCSYQYGWEKEVWQEMKLSSRYRLPDYDESEFLIENATDASAVSFMIRSSVLSGGVGEDRLAYATGHAQTVKLSKRCAGNLYVQSGSDKKTATGYANAYQVTNYTLLDNSRLIRFACPAGELVRAQYHWEAEPVHIYQATATFS